MNEFQKNKLPLIMLEISYNGNMLQFTWKNGNLDNVKKSKQSTEFCNEIN